MIRGVRENAPNPRDQGQEVPPWRCRRARQKSPAAWAGTKTAERDRSLSHMTEAAGDRDHPVFFVADLESGADRRLYRERVTPQSHLLDEDATWSVGSGFAPDNPCPAHEPRTLRENAPTPTRGQGHSPRTATTPPASSTRSNLRERTTSTTQAFSPWSTAHKRST
jgi:hypothetical protein